MGKRMVEPTDPEKILEKEEEEKLYQGLISEYIQVKDRSDAYVTRAQNLLGFAGIVNTILVALMVTVVSNKEARTLLHSSPILPYFEFTIKIGFLGYILSIILALAAFRTTKYTPVPQLASREFINDIFQKKAHLPLKPLSMQVCKAIHNYNKINDEKYRFLLWSTVFLTLAIISTAFLGILILSMI